jgi:long-chain acyl-CoA synthetase
VVIDALYGDKPAVDIDTTIKFQDGKTARIQTTLIVRRLTAFPGKAA